MTRMLTGRNLSPYFTFHIIKIILNEEQAIQQVYITELLDLFQQQKCSIQHSQNN